MQKKLLESPAEAIQSGLTVGRKGRPVLGTAAIAESKNLALSAKSGKRVLFGFPEMNHGRIVRQAVESSLLYVSDKVLRVDKMVARIKPAVVFQDSHIAACLPVYA